MTKLIELKPEDFSEEKYAALAWARDFAVFRGEFPDPEVVERFEAHYDEQKRHDILAVVTVMDFANRFMNTATGDVLKSPGFEEPAK